MVKVPKMIKAVLNFSKKLPEQLLAHGYAILKAMTGNANFPNVPIDLNVLKTTLDAYSASIGDAKDGSKKAKTLRDRLGEEIVWMLRAVALYVELNCKNDMNTFLTSGFQARSNAPAPAQPLAQPTITGVDQGVSGEFRVSASPFAERRTTNCAADKSVREELRPPHGRASRSRMQRPSQ